MKRILIVDDKEENRYYLKALLQGHDHQVDSARHGAEALVLARQSPPDIVISDLLMPVMDGYTLLQHWKADPGLKAIPFVVYTATYTEAEDEQLALDLGADAFILKPTEPEDFIKRIQAVQSKPPAAGARPADPGRSDETDLLKVYSQTLIRKLEKKSLELEATNKSLQLDITRREAAEAALKASEERFRLLAMATNDAVWDWDIAQDKRWWGAGFTDLFGHEQREATSNDASWVAYLHPEDRDQVLQQLQSAIDGDSVDWYADYRFRRADGSWAQVQDRGHLLRDAQGKTIRMVGGLSDVTERLALEHQLRHSQRMESLGQLTGGVAHDFNNLLTVVMGNAELLHELLTDDPDRQALAQIIMGAAERGADLTHRLLAFARKQPLSPVPVDLNQLVENLAPLLRRLLGGHVELSLEREQNLPAALMDSAQLENALLNLCINARDAMPNGGTLTIRTGAGKDPDGHSCLVLGVLDTGIGIDAEHLAVIFEPFFSTKEEGKGTGLGLAMVYGLVKQSGSQITVDSEPGRGTHFKLYLPLAQEACPGNDAPTTPTSVAGGTARILLVEDDDLVRQFAQSQLTALGYQVTSTVNSDEALTALQADQHFDLLFTDLIMPGINGRDLAIEARRLRPGLKVLFTSGFPGKAVAPGDDLGLLLTKPYHRADLAQHVAQALHGEPALG